MENEIVMKFEGLAQQEAEEKVMRCVGQLPGIEYASVDCDSGIVTVIGGDIDRLGLEDSIEALGFPLVR